MSSSRFHQPWINNKIKRLSRRKKRAYRKAKRRGEQEDIDKYKQLQKDRQYESKQAYNKYISNMVTEDSNPKKLNSFINAKRCESSGVSVLKKDGVSYSDPKVKSTILNDQFSSVFTDEDFTNLHSMPSRPFPKMT